MTTAKSAAPVTVFAAFRLAEGRTEADLLAASQRFQEDFVSQQPGVLRRELIRKADGGYIDIVQFRSAADVDDVLAKEKESAACNALFSILEGPDDGSDGVTLHDSLATYVSKAAAQ